VYEACREDSSHVFLLKDLLSNFTTVVVDMKLLFVSRREIKIGAKVQWKPWKRNEVLSSENKQSSDRAVSLPCASSDRWYQRLSLFRILRLNRAGSNSTVDTLAPFAYIDFDSQNEDSEYQLSQPLPSRTKSSCFQRHGLDRKDSILSYLQQVDEAYESLLPQRKSDATMKRSISVITMDPDLTYRHRILLHDSSMSSRSISSSFSMYEDEDVQEITMDHALPYRRSILLHDDSMSLRSISSTFSMSSYEDEDSQDMESLAPCKKNNV
jgi:hypothetical protein